MQRPEVALFPLLLEVFVSFPDSLEFNGQYAAIPPHMQEAIRRYVINGIKPGRFLTGVITNNLSEAVNNADETNLPLLRLYVLWFYNEAPGSCWGSVNALNEWMKFRPVLTFADPTSEVN